jgi:hypothetical protein
MSHTGNRNPVLLQRLPQNLQGIPGKFRQLVKKQHPLGCKCNLTRYGNPSPAGKGGGSHRVMGRSKRPSGNDRDVR